MSRPLFIISLYLTIICSSLFGKIIEVESFQQIVNYINVETLVLLDIDDTLLIPIQTLGTDAWFMAKLKDHLKQEKEYSLALDKTLAEWEAVRHLTSVQVVEEGTPEIVNEMQKNGVVVMGLTTQGLALATRTVMQLESLNIHLSTTAPSHQDHYFMNGKNGVLYREGILFTSGTPKGKALLAFLDIIDYHPKKIVFINDKKTHLEDVENALTIEGIEFTGLRYSYSDQRVLNYNPEIADIQWTHSTFDHLLSDEEAASLIGLRDWAGNP